MAIERKRMVLQDKPTLFGDLVLTLLDLCIEKLFDAAAIETDQMVVVGAFVEFEDGFARLEVRSQKKAGLLELGEHSIDRGQTNVHLLRKQNAIDIFRGEVPHFRLLEDREDSQSRERDLQASALESSGKFVGGSHARMIARCDIPPEFLRCPPWGLTRRASAVGPPDHFCRSLRQLPSRSRCSAVPR